MGLAARFDSMNIQTSFDPGQTVLEYACPEDLRLFSIQLILTGQVKGDSFKVEIYDKDGVWGDPGLISTLINKWAVNPASPLQSLPALAENQPIPQGIYLRITYDSVGMATVDITANLQLYAVT